MAHTTRAKHPSPQVFLLALGALFIVALVVLALLSLAGWL